MVIHVEASLALRQHLFHAITAVPDDDHRTFGAETVCCGEHVVEQRPTSDVVQDLGQARTHPLSKSCRENDHRSGRWLSHPGSRVEGGLAKGEREPAGR